MAKVEQEVADIACREELSDCNCQEITLAMSGQPEKFEREMNLPCPTHGFRRLGRITWIQFVAAENGRPKFDERIQKDDAAIQRLLDIYNARLAEDDRLKREKEAQEQDDGAQDF